MKSKLVKLAAYAVATIGVLASSSSYVGCILLMFDEPEVPESMIK